MKPFSTVRFLGACRRFGAPAARPKLPSLSTCLLFLPTLILVLCLSVVLWAC